MRYSGYIGFSETYEKEDGIWDERIVEQPYYGDVVSARRNDNENAKVNDDMTMSNKFSIVADSYLYSFAGRMRYITFMGEKWKITSVEYASKPRVTISVGGVYHG